MSFGCCIINVRKEEVVMQRPVVKPENLFIFTDASVTKRGGEYFSCAGAIAVVAHSTDDFEIIDETFQIKRLILGFG
jgi:hypothetical protein